MHTHACAMSQAGARLRTGSRVYRWVLGACTRAFCDGLGCSQLSSTLQGRHTNAARCLLADGRATAGSCGLACRANLTTATGVPVCAGAPVVSGARSLYRKFETRAQRSSPSAKRRSAFFPLADVAATAAANLRPRACASVPCKGRSRHVAYNIAYNHTAAASSRLCVMQSCKRPSSARSRTTIFGAEISGPSPIAGSVALLSAGASASSAPSLQTCHHTNSESPSVRRCRGEANADGAPRLRRKSGV